MKTPKKGLQAMKAIAYLLFLLGHFAGQAQKKNKAALPEKQLAANPVFSNFSYQGRDSVYINSPLQEGEFYSPILQGCYPDPSIVKRGKDYFLVNSTFAMFPGVPIFHSTDLVNWKQIGHVLDRPSQLKVDKAGFSEGIYAPCIRYNPHNQTFYMITTQLASGIGNMVVKTRDPFKGWGEIIKLKFGGIDPSMLFDDDGKAYIVHNDAPEKGKTLYNGHRVIKLWEYDVEKDEVVPGTDKILVDGGVDKSQKPIWIEGPHLYKKNGKYYLMCAEGGTGGWHSEVIFISDSPKGPFLPAPGNPILTQRYLPTDRKDKVDWTGHADLVEGPDGKYYGVFLGVRPNQQNRVTCGRETFLLPVDWSGNFPVFENGLLPLKPKLSLPEGVSNKTGREGFRPNGNFSFIDNFGQVLQNFEWIAMRGPKDAFISQEAAGGVGIKPFATNILDKAPIAALFRRFQHNSFEVNVTMDYKPGSNKDLAGVTFYQSENSNYVFGITKRGPENMVVLARTNGGTTSIVASDTIIGRGPVQLQVVANQDKISFNYAEAGKPFKNLGGTVSADVLSTNLAGGFTGALYGLYATAGNTVYP